MTLTNKYFPVLNHGFIALKDYMGGDEEIEQAARISYGKGTRTKSDTRNLIRYLVRQSHSTPLEMVEFKFHIACPIFVMRQWIRHRTANVNEYSGRYSEMPNLFYVPERDKCATQSTSNKQGRSENILSEEKYEEYLKYQLLTRDDAVIDYNRNLHEFDLARELARIDLPLSTYTYFFWKMDLHNLFHFLKLRLDPHAQYEIRAYAEVIAAIVQEICPIAFEAFVDYSLTSVKFTQDELKLLTAPDYLMTEDYEELANKMNMSKREREEYKEKIKIKINGYYKSKER